MRLTVFNGNLEAGVISRVGSKITFTYTDSYRALKTATPLSVSMPLITRRHSDRVISPWLWGLLPDSEAVLKRWAREMHTTLSHPLGILARQGRDLPGAFQIIPEEAATEYAPSEGAITWLTEADVASRLAQVRTDHTAWLGTAGDGRWSLAGAQAKIALRSEDGRWGEPRGAEPTTHILKPAIEGLDHHDLNEHLCLSALRSLGVPAARTSVQSFKDERAIVVERYDRVRAPSGSLVRLHQEDMCQALSVFPADKYEAEGGPSVMQIGALLRDNAGHAGRAAIRQFADALIVNWILAAPDAHAKNYSLMLQRRQVRLAPLYDIASALVSKDFYEPKIKLAMRLGSHYELAQITLKEWVQVSEQLRIDAEELIERARELAVRMPAAMWAAVDDAQVRRLESDLPEALFRAVEARSERCVKRLS
jgi:serine/threonine-protein kinase HipA